MLITDIINEDDFAQITKLNTICFPDDTALTLLDYEEAYWTIVKENDNPIAWASWYSVTHNNIEVGFLYRSGVLPEHRGRGIQRLLISEREFQMRKENLPLSITYTEISNIASQKNLIRNGYLPYWPTLETSLVEDEKDGIFIHWEKRIK